MFEPSDNMKQKIMTSFTASWAICNDLAQSSLVRFMLRVMDKMFWACVLALNGVATEDAGKLDV